MESIPKTISFRTDEITTQKMEKIKERVFEGREVSNALILRTAVDFLYDNYGKGLSDTEDVFEVVKAYVITTFLKQDDYNSGELEKFLGELEQVYEELLQEETEEIAKLYDMENPIAVAQLIRFKSRELPVTFLRIMEVVENEYKHLSDDELATLLLNKFSNEDFKLKASELFFMEF
ncbi:hypothetical protein [Lysinibacillus sp. 54212]|uniref:hypothetical protein n=1 Tax=Lysinibacillus sp. 54212 TaxID=3119829 RepID=UPI002FC6FC92